MSKHGRQSLTVSQSVSSLRAVLLGIVVFALAADAQSPGSFIATGNMSIDRHRHTATMLRDGRILIAGGGTGNTSLASAEIYDPSTGRFTVTGSMAGARYGHSATLLKDGRVLIAGGSGGCCTLASGELYDPSTGNFTATGKMVVSNADFAGTVATLLVTGKVLVVIEGNKAMLYDPATGTFAGAGNVPGGGASATPLADGRVLLFGGAVIYDPVDGRFSRTSNPPLYGCELWCTATLLSDGNVLLAGGAKFIDEDNLVVAATAELYDPTTASFKDAGHLERARFGHTATMLPGGKVLIAGGSNSLASAEFYDPSTGVFAPAGNMTAGRSNHTANLLADGTVLIAGGRDSSAELYIPSISAASSASLTAPMAPESLASLFGARIAVNSVTADLRPPPTSLGGLSLMVRDSTGVERLAPLLYTSASQINFQVPAGTAAGDTVIEIVNDADTRPSVTAQVRAVSPGIFASPANLAKGYAVRVEADGTQTILPGVSIVLDDRPVALVLFGTGIRNRSSLDNVRCSIGGIGVPVEYSGPGGGLPGLDQVNVRLTAALKGNRDGHLVLTVDGVSANTVLVDVR